MIYVTGDIHGDHDISKLSTHNLKRHGIKLIENDYLVILGDFGLPFFDTEATEKRGSYTYWIKWLASKPYTVLWIDGNHDNFNFWDAQKTTEMFGGTVQVHPRANNVIHLLRGKIYNIDGKTIFTFGGADSHDKECRTENYSWWAREAASDSEIEHALANLKAANNKVDYIFTHTPPAQMYCAFGGAFSNGKTETFLDQIQNTVDYNAWFFGHLHRDLCVSEFHNCYALYRTIVNAAEVFNN